MKRIQEFIASTLLLLLCASVGCTLPDGDPWQTVTLTTEARFDAEGRIGADGRFKTSKDYQIEFDSVALTGYGFRIEGLTVVEGLQTFDPLNPPPGYSLCHNGHCHYSDGTLVDYEDIQEELNQASGATLSSFFQELVTRNIRFTDFTQSSTIPLTLGACDDTYQLCDLGPNNRIAKVIFEAVTVGIVARIYHPEHFPDEGLELNETVDIDAPISFIFDGASSTDPNAVMMEITLNKSLWDSIEFSESTERGSEDTPLSWNTDKIRSALLTAVRDHITLSQKNNP